MSALQHQRIAELCEQFRLDRIASEWPALAQQAIDNASSLGDFLEQLLKLESDSRDERRRQTLLRLSGLPVVKTLEQFDFKFASGAPRAQIQELASRREKSPCWRTGIQVCHGWAEYPVYHRSGHDVAIGRRTSSGGA